MMDSLMIHDLFILEFLDKKLGYFVAELTFLNLRMNKLCVTY